MVKGLRKLELDLITIKEKMSIFQNGIQFKVNEAGIELINEIKENLEEVQQELCDFRKALNKNRVAITDVIDNMCDN